ncbi:MAG: mechanosensitive ion channel domain-containing protein [Actinomycetota bacterium]
MDPVPKRAARKRLVRAAIAGVVAVWGLVLASFGQLQKIETRSGTNYADTGEIVLALSGAGLALIAGVAAVRSLSRAVRLAMRDQVGDSRSGPAGLVVSAFGYVIVTFAVLSALEVNLGGLLLGGALTGVVIGIAAQQTLGNFFAGLVLLMVRPFGVGERIVLRSGPLGGEYEGVVTEMSLYYVHLSTETGPVALPNAGVLASAVGPGARTPKEEEDGGEPDKPDETQQDHGPAHGGPPQGGPA